MKSPFPGMDPFIEAFVWEDFHGALVQEFKKELGQRVPDRYVVRTGNRSYVVLSSDGGTKAHPFIPDIHVRASHGTSESGEATAVAEPTTNGDPYSLRAFVEDEFRESFVEIRDVDHEETLVTCIEVLSPSNKKRSSPGWELYQRKRQGILLAGKANLVEIDLLRGGESMPMLDPWRESPYRLLVARMNTAPNCRVWPAYMQRPLPPIPVPLLRPDSDISIEIQPMIEAIYANSKYWRSINYAQPLSPPLSAEETAWLEQQLASVPR